MSIGQRIKSARKLKKMNQRQLANMLHVTKSACGQWERGVHNPNVENLARLAIVLDVYFEWLATGRGKMMYPNVSRNPELDR